MSIKLFVATKAFIEHNGKVLILRESSNYADGTNTSKYDMPGGRLEPGQHFLKSLHREISEEAGLVGEVHEPFFVNEWRPVKNGEEWQIVGIFFCCTVISPKITLSQDHDAYEWIDPKEFKQYDLIPNLQLAFEAYLEHTQKN
ncbi:MAG TPA: NUDIX domain-containing protein [Candidatus Saccharimonadales bacterium]|jgi:8-oxo-dGTP diphosphatase|nr:NUDIX domain-containing protein [Candidatus Saccharimonadales bacterium]